MLFDRIITPFKICLIIVFGILVIDCASIRAQTPVQNCEQTVIYYVKKITERGKEIDANISVTVNPAKKTINMLVLNDGKESVKFNVLIDSKSCDLDLDRKKGMAVYQTHMKEHLNSAGTIKVKIEDGRIAISYVDDKQVILSKFFADQWEIVKN